MRRVEAPRINTKRKNMLEKTERAHRQVYDISQCLCNDMGGEGETHSDIAEYVDVCKLQCLFAKKNMQANVSARHPVERLEPDGLHTKWQTMTEERASSCNQTPKPAQMATEARIIRESFGKHQLGAHCIF